MERQPSAVDDGTPISADEARELLETDAVASLGRRADARRRRAHGDAVWYAPPPEDGAVTTRDGYTERDRRDRSLDPDEVPGGVDAVVAGPGTALADHAALHDRGVATDVAVRYGGDADLVDALVDVRDLARRTGGVRCVACVPTDDRSTAYDDLRAVAVARLVLDDDVHVRIRRPAVGEKLAQTALAYGVDDLGFAGDHGFDAELLIAEAGDEPRARGPEYHG